MPIAFPPPARGNPFDRWKWQWGVGPSRVNKVNPNMARPGVTFTSSLFDPGIGRPNARPNLRCLGITYAAPTNNAVVNPATKLVRLADERQFIRVLGASSFRLSGVTYDETSTPFGFCRVMIFRTSDNVFVGETTSDANGAWAMDMMAQGPFFRVVYKVGSPDKAGTSINTIVPSPV